MNKNYKLEFNNGQTIYKSNKNNVIKLMDDNDFIIIDRFIYDPQDNIIGKIFRLKEKNREKISKDDFKNMMILDIMKILGSLQVNRLSQADYSKKSYYKLKNKKLDK